MAQIPLIIAASIFVLLGGFHGFLTLKDLINPTAFTPPDPALREAMQQSRIALHPGINLWKAWLGFNLTHSLSLIFFGSPFLYFGIFKPNIFMSSLILQTIAVFISAIYVILCIKFFFSTPAIASAIGLICFVVAVGLANVK